MTKRIQREKMSFQQVITIVILLIMALAVVSACRPDTDSLEIVAGEATKTELPPVATSTPRPGATMTKTMQPTDTKTLLPTATATATPGPTAATEEEVEMTDQEQIRAEVLAAGIDLNDLKSSTNSYIKNHSSVENFQQDIDNSFGSEQANWETAVVMDIIQLKSEHEYENAFQTPNGWKIIAWAKTAYKKVDGEWGIINIPLLAYRENTKDLWVKFSENANEPWLWYDTRESGIIDGINTKTELITGISKRIFTKYGNYYLGTGAVVRFYTGYPNQEDSYEGKLGDNPSYTEDELVKFRLTGEADLFNYYDVDGNPFLWEFHSVNTGICKNNYGN